MNNNICLAKAAGMENLHLSVEKTNVPSVRVIQKNGGIYERSFEYEGEVADIYIFILNQCN
jgi:predicted acetyltransferase